MTNLYHVLHDLPALEEEDMYIEQERLARLLVESGLFRIDAHDKVNFARFSIPSRGINMMFSKRELSDAKLLQITNQKIAKAYSLSSTRCERVRVALKRLRKEIKKFPVISEEMELKLARIVVQAAHPVVILLILIEKVEVFLSFSYNIGDVLDVASWKSVGSNSGMQSTHGKSVAIYISCGGNPLKLGEEWKEQVSEAQIADTLPYGDGKPALARAMIIGGQEIGHYADLMRHTPGQFFSRHSANLSGTMAKEHVRSARIKDMETVEQIKQRLIKVGLNKLYKIETETKFFHKNKLRTMRAIITQIRCWFIKRDFINKARQIGFSPIQKFTKDTYVAITIYDMLKDMAFNLAPQADVYKSSNKDVEEAIACIEALARVPQQLRKWGKEIVSTTSPHLYNIYYYEVIPSRIKDYEKITGQKFTLHPENLTKKPRLDRYLVKLKREIAKYIAKLLNF
jgi:uncharacterized protein DUF2748